MVFITFRLAIRSVAVFLRMSMPTGATPDKHDLAVTTAVRNQAATGHYRHDQ